MYIYSSYIQLFSTIDLQATSKCLCHSKNAPIIENAVHTHTNVGFWKHKHNPRVHHSSQFGQRPKPKIPAFLYVCDTYVQCVMCMYITFVNDAGSCNNKYAELCEIHSAWCSARHRIYMWVHIMQSARVADTRHARARPFFHVVRVHSGTVARQRQADTQLRTKTHIRRCKFNTTSCHIWNMHMAYCLEYKIRAVFWSDLMWHINTHPHQYVFLKLSM